MLCCLVRDPSSPPTPAVLEAIARACSPRVAPFSADVVVFDASGLERAIGPPCDVAREVGQLASNQGVRVRVGMAETMTAAWLLAHAQSGISIVAAAQQGAALAPLPLRTLAMLPEFLAAARDPGAAGPARTRPRSPAPLRSSRTRRAPARHFRMAPGPAEPPATARSAPPVVQPVTIDPGVLMTLERWGLRTLGDLARLPRGDVRARLGAAGVRLHQAACGDDVQVLAPAGEARHFRERFELEWPIEGLEPLSFVLSRLCDALSAALERADRGAVDVTTSLWLVTREWHRRTLHLPAPMRDARVLRTLILLDLESHPPTAGIDAVEVEAGVVPGRIAQGSLLDRTLPSPEDLATLIARLGALMGEARVGAPALVDTHDERAVAMTGFVVRSGREVRSGKTEVGSKWEAGSAKEAGSGKTEVGGKQEVGSGTEVGSDPLPVFGLRRFRLPIAARVIADRGTPARVWPAARHLPGGEVVACAGPWRSSGRWWVIDGGGWDRDEWDVAIGGGPIYRVARDRASGQWSVEGLFD